VRKYKSKDGEEQTIQNIVQAYRLSMKSIFSSKSSPFTIKGTAPVK